MLPPLAAAGEGRANDTIPPETYPALMRARRRPGRRSGLALTVALFPAWMVLLVLVTPAAGANSNATFGLGPAGPKGLDGRAGYNYVSTPGSTVNDDVAVVNLANQPVTLGLYPTDGVPGPGGTVQLPPASVAPTEVGAWIKLRVANQTVSVAARSTVIVPLVVAVPADAEPGDHAGGIVASLATYAKNSQGDIVHVDQRVAVRVLVRVSGTLLARLSVEGVHATYHQTLDPVGRGFVTVRYTVVNTGNVKLSATSRVVIRGLLGTSEAAAPLPSIPVLLPGARIEGSARLRHVPPEPGWIVVSLAFIALVGLVVLFLVEQHIRQVRRQA